MTDLQNRILAWFQKNGRDLPWRKTYDPYQVWISEIMLQQTQMDRAVDYFNSWMRRFSDIESIAVASEEEVLKLWEGLGYYARARNIMKSARVLQDKFNGLLPADYDLLLSLPGIGKYTAAAIMSIAFNSDYPLVDANIERIFARLFNLKKPVKEKETQAFIWQKAGELLPHGKARLFNQAMMELGALVCIAKNPRCKICPISKNCRAFSLGLTGERPILQEPVKTIFIEMATGILQRQGRILIQKRKANGVWANLWEFPGGRLEPGETPEMALVREYLEETQLAVSDLIKITTVQHSYTIYRVTLHCYFCSLPNNGRQEPVLHTAQEYRWIKPAELSKYAFPAGHRKLIRHLQNNMNLFQET
ncbi:MAG: A/G-specific adenine glycosylase [Deltaproteobacteria bacterium]|nr:A/G-specific adenine glycosylase [Deltaproteobacteria bacterium]